MGIFNKFINRLKHLALYSKLRKVFGKEAHQKSSLQKENRAWASKMAVEQQEAIINLFKARAEKFSEKYPQEFQSAMEIPKKSSEKEEFVASDLLYAACEFTQSKNVMEIGLGNGWSSLVCLKSLEKRNGRLYTANRSDIDRLIEKNTRDLVPQKLHKNWRHFQYSGREALVKMINECGSIDVVHYNSEDSYEEMKWAYETLFPQLRKGGVFISNDMAYHHAFREFCEGRNLSPTVVNIGGKLIGVFIK